MRWDGSRNWRSDPNRACAQNAQSSNPLKTWVLNGRCDDGYRIVSRYVQCEMVGARGFEPPTPWSRNRSGCYNVLILLVRCCVVVHRFSWYLGRLDPSLDPSFKIAAPTLPRALKNPNIRRFKARDGFGQCYISLCGYRQLGLC